MKQTRVLIVDDHAILRMGLASLINAKRDLCVIGEAEDGASALAVARKTKPDVIIMDLMMPDMDGAETTRQLMDENPSARILILTSFGTSDALRQALDAGALGAIMKSAPFTELYGAIRAVAEGRRSVCEEIDRILSTEQTIPRLSPRQREILGALARGLSNADIAQSLKIGKDVVKLHVNALMQKLDAANRTEAVAIAYRKHLLKS